MYLSCMPTKWFALKSCTFVLNHHAHVMPENKPKAGMALRRFSKKNKQTNFAFSMSGNLYFNSYWFE